jgi:TolB-like protein/Tfp pilus assembly protein PilF
MTSGRERERDTGALAEQLDDTLTAPIGPARASTATPVGPDAIAGRYEILGLLGAGGMGTVYKVRDRQLDEIVALKTLKREWIDAPGALERFKREVKLARRVTHKNVARTFDIGETETEKFLTMEHVDGPSLARVLDERGALPIEEVLRIGAAITEALEAAHEAGVIHRDLKPDNVLVGKDGRVVVTDFGIARGQVADAGTTGAGAIVGTPAYMSPEQVEGAAVDPRSDLYALGLVLHEMLTGARAFSGDSPLAVAAARLVRPPPPVDRVDAPEALRALVRALLERRPADRPSGAAELKRALGAIAPPGPVGVPARAPDLALAAQSLAVMPIRSSGPPEDAWIAEGITDDLLDGLCMVRALRVRTRTTPSAGEDARSFGRRVQVGLVVDGGVRRSGDQVRLGLRLSSTDDGFQIWAGRFEGAIGELLVLADRAARDIAAAVGATQRESSGAAMPVDPRALELHARARTLALSAQLETPAGRAEIDEALRLAPHEPRILATHAILYARQMFSDNADRGALLAVARASAERAVDIAPEVPEAWVALASVRLSAGETVLAARAAHRALRLGPSVGAAHEIGGRILSEAGRLQEARALLTRAIWLDGTLNHAITDLVRVHGLLGERDRVLVELDRLTKLVPLQGITAALRVLAWWPGTPLPEAPPTMEVGELGARVHAISRAAHHGNFDEDGRRFLQGMVARLPPRSRPRRFVAQVATELHARAGRIDEALALLEDAVSNGVEDFAWLEHCPTLDVLRGTPRFDAAVLEVRARRDAILAAWDEN